MPLLETETIQEEQSVKNRLISVKKSLQKATQEALKHATAAELRPSELPENDDPNASFHLGMELFGQETSVIEKHVRTNLEKLEHELEEVSEMKNSRLSNVDEDEDSDADDSFESPAQLELEAKKLQTKIRFLRECSSARSLLDESVVLSSPALSANAEPDLLESAKRLVLAQASMEKAQNVVADSDSADNQSPELLAAYKILDSIQASVRRQKVDLIGRAKSLWQASVTLAPGSLAVRGSDKSGLAVAYDILEVFAEDGSSALEAVLRKFVKTLHHDVFRPVLESHLAGKAQTSWVFSETEDRGSATNHYSNVVSASSSTKAKGPVHRLEWSREDDEILGTTTDQTELNQPSSLAAWKETIAFVHHVVTFVAVRVLLQRDSLCKVVGDRLFGKPGALPSALNLDALGLESCMIGNDNGLLMEPLVDAMSETCVPNYLKPSETDQLYSMAKELRGFVDPFLQDVIAKRVLSGENSRLAVFAATFEQKYVDNRRCLILNEARNLLIKNDYHNTVEVGVEVHDNKDERLGMGDDMAVFKLHRSSISDTASKLMALCRKAMDEAVEQQVAPADTPLSLLPATLYRTAREVLDLFRAIVPVTYGSETTNVPRTAAVFHNDSVFFAHHCLTLGLEYKDKFPPAEPDDARGNLLRQTCFFVDMVPLFRDLAERSMGNMLDLQANQIVEIVGQRITLFDRALRSDEILAEWSEAETALTAGLYHLRHLSQAWKPVLSYDVFNRSMCYLADVIFTLYLDQLMKATDISANASGFVSTLFQKATHDIGELVSQDKSGSRVWDRFSAASRFMDMSLADIQAALGDGVFRSVTGPELTRLITAAFDDTPKRRNLLKLLASN
jgi:centromere/kinetochore protein ZW10